MKPLITFALTAVLAIALTSCRKNQFHKIDDGNAFVFSRGDSMLYLATRTCYATGVFNYQLCIINRFSLESKYISVPDFIAITVVDDGFKIAVPEWKTAGEVCAPWEEKWMIHDEYLDWDGNVIRIDSTEYDIEELNTRYGKSKDDYIQAIYGDHL